jgi:hypothetical protein
MLFALVLPFALAFFALSCEQPFKAGLGSVIDIRPPTVTLKAPGAGAYIYGQRMPFTGFAEDDYVLDKVEIQVTNHPTIGYLKNWTQVTLEKTAQNKGNWTLLLNTTEFPDGDLNIRLRASDTSGREPTTTDEIVFLIRNDMPRIKLTMPNILDPSEGTSGEGAINSDINETNLNFGIGGQASEDELPLPAMYKRSLNMGSRIGGTIKYDMDIYTVPYGGSPETGRYPPQIRIWPISSTPAPGEYALGEWPSYSEVPWKTFAYDTGNLFDDQLFTVGGVGSYGFTWDAPDPGRFYGLEIRAQAKNAREDGSIASFHYPRDFWPSVEAQGNDWENPPTDNSRFGIKENRYVLFYVKEQSTLPNSELYMLEDILNENNDPAGNWANGKYKPLRTPLGTYGGSELADNEAHPYVNRLTVNKNGPFTLRIKAYHPEGIESAEVYWQRDDGERGRFIWDPADKLKGSEAANNVSASSRYDKWGYKDPHNSTTSNFIFTYKHDGTDTIPNEEAYHELVRGRSKVQSYAGPADEWDEGKREGKWPERAGQWTDLKDNLLGEGTYEIEVYVRKDQYEGRVPDAYSPSANTIRLDWGAPSVEINTIDGAYSLDLTEDDPARPWPEAIVNGVIRTRMRFSDSRIEDTGLRGATDGYFKRAANSDNYGYEQFYVLVGKNDNTAMNDNWVNVNGKTLWPLPMGIAFGDTVSLTGVTVHKHGPIFDSEFMIKTSKIYDALTTEPDTLPDGEYWLYVFARDNAFNVGCVTPLKVVVDEKTDYPYIEFLGEIDASVINPNVSADSYITLVGPLDKHGFWNGGSTPRNNFGTSSNIRLKLGDDDGLDLGMAAPGVANESKVKVTFTGSKNVNGTITPRDLDGPQYLMTLSDADVKDIFAPQPAGDVGGRQVVRARESKSGEIHQSRLLALLKAKGGPGGEYEYLFAPKGGVGAYNSLPDGIYRIQITIDDYVPAKLKMATELSPADLAHATIEFWIIVDSTTPVVNVTDWGTTEGSDYISPYDLGDGTDGIRILGTVSDINGPVRASLFEITNDVGIRPPEWEELVGGKKKVYTDPDEVQALLVPDELNDKVYTAAFTAPVHIHESISSKFRVRLQMEDRYGRKTLVEQPYQIDKEGPKVSLRKTVDTFERDDPDRVYQTVEGDISQDNRKRLANGVTSFNISASDNLKLSEVRWWLLPASVTDFTTRDNGLEKIMGWDFPQTNTGGRKFGSYTDNFTRTIFIDTNSLTDNTEYNLYVMAQDDAKNVSDISIAGGKSNALLQTFYVLQKEDAPYFSKNSLSGVVGENDIVARITINDDDGFSVPGDEGLEVRPGTVRIWMKRPTGSPATITPPPAGFNPDSLGDNQTADWTAPVTLPNAAYPEAKVNLLGRKNISLSIDLGSIGPFSDIMDIPGKKYYVVEATDSWSDKYINETVTPPALAPPTATAPNPADGKNTYTKFWREAYEFDLDNVPPKINITAPVTGTFGKTTNGVTANSFMVTGSISDANLKKAPDDGSYIIGIRLGDKTLYPTTLPNPNPDNLTFFKLGTGAGNKYITTIQPDRDAFGNVSSGDTRVNFSIPAIDFLSALPNGIDYDSIPSGNHNLLFLVEDQSGKTGNFSLRFIKDQDTPVLDFTNISNTTTDTATPPKPVALAANYWTTTGYAAKRDTRMPVIWYDNDVPAISGTFNDELSNIDKSSFRVRFDGNLDNLPAGTTQNLTSFASDQLVGDAKYVRWTIYLTKNGTNTLTSTNTILPDGVHSIQLAIKDAAGNELSDGYLYGFRINSQPPTATIAAPAGTTGVYGDRTGIAGTGTVFTFPQAGNTGVSRNLDDVELTIRYTGGGEMPTKTSHTWHLLKTIPTASLPANESNVTTIPGTWTFNPAALTTPPIDLIETRNWAPLAIPKSYIWLVTNTGTIPANTLLRSGTYEVVVTAVDRNGKRSEEGAGNTWSFVVDSAPPTFTFTNPRLENSPPADPVVTTAPNRAPNYWTSRTAERNVISAEDPSIRGRVSDTNNLDEVEIQLARWVYTAGVSVGGSWQVFNFTTGNSWTTVNDTSLAADSNWSKVLVPVGTPPAKPESPEYVLNWLFTGVDSDPDTAGIQPLPDGYYSVRLRARDISIAGGAAPGWSSTANGGNPAYSNFTYFFLDRNNPSVTSNNSTTTTFSSRYITAATNPARPQYGLEFSVTASDNNRFEKMEVLVERVNGTGGILPNTNASLTSEGTARTILFPTPTANTGTWVASGNNYTATVMLAFQPREVIGSTGHATNGLPDGAYRIIFTATDLAGKTFRETRTITLDNKPPVGKINEPMFVGDITRHDEDGVEATPKVVIHQFASDIKIGGETFTIAGETDDLGDNGSASGPAGIWYRIGYGTQGKTTLPNVAGMTDVQRSQAIMAWATGTNNGSGVIIANGDTGAASNNIFDTASQKTAGSLWFKYTPAVQYAETGTYDVPTGFSSITAIDLYKWALDASATGAASVATSYAVGTVSIRGRTFTDGANTTAGVTQFLARQITENELPRGMRRGGLFSLPLVIRVVDNAGNVSYELRDIWLYPNGDNPSSTIINPSARFTGYTGATGNGSPRGGQMQIQGVATDNKSVRTVIYRVKADTTENETTTPTPGVAPTGNGTYTINNDGTVTGEGPIVLIPGARTWESHPEYGTGTTPSATDTMRGRWNNYGAANVTGIDGTTQLTQTGWYVANLESQSYAPTMGWDFMLNASAEINALIDAHGFTYNNNKYMRIWVEVLVFDGNQPTATATNNYNLMSLGDENTNAAKPRPYVREFYYTTSAPSITTKRISALGSTTPDQRYGNDSGDTLTPTAAPVASNYIRSGNFALRATLNGNSNDIGQIAVRLPGETNNDWRPVYVRNETPAVKTVNGVSLGTWTGATRTATLTYTFDSTRTASNATYQAVREGAWGTSGTLGGGTFTVEVRIRDTSSPPAESVYTFEVGVDNRVPVADQLRTVTSAKVAGSNVSFLGRAFDYQGIPGSPQPEHKGITQVRAWFTPRNNTAQYVNMSTGIPGTTTTTSVSAYTKPAATIGWNAAYDTVTSVTRTGTLGNTTNYNVPTLANYVKTLNQGTALPGTGMTWSPTNNWDIFWSFELNTLNLPDGLITMHYIVEDHANNRSYYTQDMVVMNNTPKITKVTLFTNNTGTGAVFTQNEGNDMSSPYDIPEVGRNATYEIGEYNYASGYLNSGFISKNRVVGFGIETTGTKASEPTGNTPLNYQARYVERYLVPLSTTNLRAMINGQNGLSTLQHLPNTATIGANGIPSTTTIEGDLNPSTRNNFVNLYTIATGNGSNLSPDQWKALGVPVVTPVDGVHFVFQPNADMVTAIQATTNPVNYSNVYVFAYRQVIQKPSVQRTGNNANTIPPESLSFSGSSTANPSGDFANAGYVAGKISEAKATKPQNPVSGDDTGTAYFLIKVWDSVAGTGTTPENQALYDAIVIGMRVYVSDTKPPFARLYDLNPYTEIAVVGNNIGTANQNSTRNAAAAPTDVGENIKRGGLYNLGTERAPIKSGYIEPRFGANNGTTALNPYVNRPNHPEDPYLGSLQERPNGYVSDPADAVATTGTASQDKVSGTVLLRGLAWDDQLIDEIRLNIAGQTTAKTILKLTDGRMVAQSGVQAWAYETIHWQTGHTVEWAYLWNTETEPSATGTPAVDRSTRGGPVSNVTVSLIVLDKNGALLTPNPTATPSQPATTATTTAQEAANPSTVFHNTVTVDIVPYVIGFERDVRSTAGYTPLYATKRSRQGWYSFFRGEGNIALNGYNLGENALTMTIQSGASTTATITDAFVTTNNLNRHIFSIPATAPSGRINVRVGNTAAGDIYNHTSAHANKSWNKESNAYTDGSDLWNNKPHAHIWRTEQTTTSTNTAPATLIGGTDSAALQSPGMVLEYQTNYAPLRGAWSAYATAGFYYGQNTNATRTPLRHNEGEPFSASDISMYNGTGVPNVVATYQGDGQPSIRLRTIMSDGGTISNTNLIPMTNIVTGTPTQRWQNTRISKAAANGSTDQGNAGRVHVTSYDAYNQSLFYTYHTTGTTQPTAAVRAIVDGHGTATAAINGHTPISNTNVGLAASNNAGEYSAVDYDATGPVIAYYDQENDTVRLAFGRAATPGTGADQWYRRYLLPSDHSLFKGSGKYISIKVDKNNGIHLAFWNSTYNTVVYAYASGRAIFSNNNNVVRPAPRNTFSLGTAGLYVCTIDNVVRSGQWTDISVDNNGNPMIVYGDNSRIGNYDGVRIAYYIADATGLTTISYTGTLTCPVTGATITGWEALSMPAAYKVNDDRLNVEVWPPTLRGGTLGTAPSWNAAVGYGSDCFRVGYFFYPTYKGY